MSITVRLFTPEDLELIKTGKDLFLTTVFLNKKNFSKEEMAVYPYDSRREFEIHFKDNNFATVYATDEENLKKFLQAEYHTEEIANANIYEIETTSIPVDIDFT